MDADKFLGTLTNSVELLARAPELLYAQRHESGGAPCIIFAFTDEPKRHVERFASVENRDIWWNEFVTIMTTMCSPPCVAIREILFQPAYLHRFVCCTKEEMHFVILDFRNDRTVWMGHRKKENQIALFIELSEILKPILEDHKPSPFSKHFTPPK